MAIVYCGSDATSLDIFDYSKECFSPYAIPAISGIDLVLNFALSTLCLYFTYANKRKLAYLLRERKMEVRPAVVFALLLRTFFAIPAKIYILWVRCGLRFYYAYFQWLKGPNGLPFEIRTIKI